MVSNNAIYKIFHLFSLFFDGSVGIRTVLF